MLGGISFHLTLTTALQILFGNGIPDKQIKTLASEVRSNLCLVSQRNWKVVQVRLARVSPDSKALSGNFYKKKKKSTNDRAILLMT